MPTFNTLFGKLDITTRPKRRRAVSMIVKELGRIHGAEEAYMERMPENFQLGEAYAAADYSVEALADAILLLMDAY